MKRKRRRKRRQRGKKDTEKEDHEEDDDEEDGEDEEDKDEKEKELLSTHLNQHVFYHAHNCAYITIHCTLWSDAKASPDACSYGCTESVSIACNGG